MSIQLNQTFEMESCCNCRVAFAIPTDLMARLRQTHRLFYCPNGHGQSYMGETMAEKLSRELKQEKALHLETSIRADTLEREREKFKKRISAGVCPCCKRSFGNLAAHMKTKHRNFATLPAAKHKELTA